MKNYNEWKKEFENQHLEKFNADSSGVVWLKLKSIIRKNILPDFLQQNQIILNSTKEELRFEELYNLYFSGQLSETTINNFLISYNKVEINTVEKNFKQIESELYKVQDFVWGGDARNSLDKQIVSYIKKISNYDEINQKIDGEIAQNTKNYTINSWYNNWSAILTEHLFKSHTKVLSAIGKVKSVDFFIDDIPYDLKITYFPKEYLKQERKSYGFENEISALKKLAKTYGVTFDKTCSEEVIKYQIEEQLRNLNNKLIDERLNSLKNENEQIIMDNVNYSGKIIKWLYENQGEMRFGAENRLFVILVDKQNLSDSWKLKRNFALQREYISKFLDDFDKKSAINQEIIFNFKGNEYRTLAKTIFIIK